MSESIRSITVTVRVDTNKRTSVVDIDADSLDDALYQVREHMDDLRWWFK